MSPLPTSREPPVALGMLSLVLGCIGMLLFFLPILGGPISVFGLFFGLIGVVISFIPGGLHLRWSLLGCLVSSLALMVNAALSYAPQGNLLPPAAPTPWQPVPDVPYNSPPARPGKW